MQRLSAQLAKATSNKTYHEAVSLSFQFIYNVLYDNSTGLVQDQIDAASCKLSADILPQGSGLFVEGAALMGDLTGDDSYRAL